jgi:uncharacterized protein
LVLTLLVLATLSTAGDYTPPPKPERYVTDNAGVLTASRADALNEKLAQFERDKSTQLLVYIERRIPPDTTLEELAVKAFESWGVGQKGKDNGAILFLFIDDRKMRIEVGYGLEGALTDARSSRIIDDTLRPALRAGDFDGAVESGAEAMMAAVRGEAYQGTGATVAESIPNTPTGPFMTFLSWVFGILVILVMIGVPALVIWAIVHTIRNRGKTFSSSSSSRWPGSSSGSSWSSSSSSSSSSRSSSSSSFSGGGGRSGGGGASGGW